MYFKVLAATETGQKFAAFRQKLHESEARANEVATKYEFDMWVRDRFYIAGSILGARFPDNAIVDSNLWTLLKRDGYYTPSKKTKEGKALAADITAVPKVSIKDLNACIGVSSIFNSIGYKSNEDGSVFGFEVEPKWNMKIPSDCIEITYSEYKKINEDEQA